MEKGNNKVFPFFTVGARYKNFRKYLYTYSAESRNGVAGTANLRNGPKVSCKVCTLLRKIQPLTAGHFPSTFYVR